MIQVGQVSGVCSRCGKTLYAQYPEDSATCDCSEYCPRDHGNGPYMTKLEDYTPDLSPSTYGPVESESGSTWGDTEHPIEILKRCPVCGYLSSQKPMEVALS